MNLLVLTIQFMVGKKIVLSQQMNKEGENFQHYTPVINNTTGHDIFIYLFELYL